jgi:hypothetical protein
MRKYNRIYKVLLEDENDNEKTGSPGRNSKKTLY